MYAMVLTGPWMIEKFRSGKLDFGVALIPRVPMAEAVQLGIVPPGTDENSTAARALSAGNVGGQNVMVTARSEHPDICLAFALHFTGAKVQREWGEKLGQIPVRLAAQQNLDMRLFPEIPVFIEQARLARPMLPLPYVGMIETEIANPETNLVLQGKQSPEQALKNIDAALTRRVLTPVNEAEAAGRK
jgi:ABC-type glycerol-3-phosphate transport system substrate-binding protein